MRYYICILFCFVFPAIVVQGQNYYQVSHISGVQTIGNVNVTVIPINSPGSYLAGSCGAAPYHIGSGPTSSATSNGYRFVFSRPVREARFQITASEPGEEMSFQKNLINYTLTSSNLSNFSGTCGTNGNSAISSRGTLIFTSGGNNNTEVRIRDSITSVTIYNIDTIAGSVFNFHFVLDTVITVPNLTDTMLCVGDTMHIHYSVSGTFAPNNQFIFQLSNASGNFSSPTVLKIINGTTSGVCNAVVPPSGSATGYRLRVLSTNPAFTSTLDTVNISIGNPPVASIYNTGPVCEGSFVQMGYTNYSHFTEVLWSRFGGSVFSKLQHYGFLSPVLADSGLYLAMMQDYGCMVFDTTRLVIKPNTLKAISSTNSPVCKGDTLKMKGNIDSAGVMNVWYRPGGIIDSTKDLTIDYANYTDSGLYVLLTKLNGCLAFDTTHVQIKYLPVPGLEDISTCFGDSIRLHIKDNVANASYVWTGPNGFGFSKRDTTIKPVPVTANGIYTATVSVNGCVAKDTMMVAVRALPQSPVMTTNAPLCAGQTLQLGINEIQTGVSYTWQGPNGFTSNNTTIALNAVTVNATGKYILTAQRDGCYTADTGYVLVKPTPQKPDITTNSPLTAGATLFLQLNNQENGISYLWTGPMGFSSSLLNPSIEKIGKSHEGTYTLTAEKDGCINAGIVQVVITDVADTGYLVLYPNANNGNFTIKGIMQRDQYIALRIVNEAGQSLYNATVATINKQLLYDVKLNGMLASGVYFLRVSADGKTRTIRFVVCR